MVLSLAYVAMSAQHHQIPARLSRTVFSRAIASFSTMDRYTNKAKQGSSIVAFRDRAWTKADVRHVLGPPDEIRPSIDEPGMTSEATMEAWCYGTNGAHTMATLGTVIFKGGVVCLTYGGRGEPPPTTVIREAELVRTMRHMFEHPRFPGERSNPLHLIRAANALIALGQKKAIAALGEYFRVADDQIDSDWLFWLVRIAFTSKASWGEFPVPRIGALMPIAPVKLANWPTFPVAMADNVPFCLLRGYAGTGSPERFDAYLRRHEKEWVIRKTPIVPPDDPYPACRKLVASPIWPSACECGRPGVSCNSQGFALTQILILVRDAYLPEGNNWVMEDEEGSNYDKYHRGFLALRCHWDSAKQRYVRR